MNEGDLVEVVRKRRVVARGSVVEHEIEPDDCAFSLNYNELLRVEIAECERECAPVVRFTRRSMGGRSRGHPWWAKPRGWSFGYVKIRRAGKGRYL